MAQRCPKISQFSLGGASNRINLMTSSKSAKCTYGYLSTYSL